MDTKAKQLITDAQSLTGACNRFGHAIRVYDDGYGPLWIHRNSIGISGIVRARTWEDAYSICEDEFFPEADETIEELQAEYNVKREHVRWVREIATGNERPARSDDYPLNEHGLEFARCETVETRIDPEDHSVAFMDNELFQEAYGFRPNGPRVGDKHKHGIYAKDLNGDSLDQLTPTLLAELNLKLMIEGDAG